MPVGIRLLARLERRLDNVVHRLGVASTREQARQFVGTAMCSSTAGA